MIGVIAANRRRSGGVLPYGIAQFKFAAGHSVTFSVAPTNGSTLVALITDTSATQTANTGWTIVQQAGTFAGQSYAVAVKLCGTGESATQQPTTSAGGGESLFMWEIGGLNVTTPTVSIKVHTGTSNFTNTTGWGLTPSAAGQIGLTATNVSSAGTLTVGSLGAAWTNDVNNGSDWGGNISNPTSGAELNFDLGWSGFKNFTTLGVVVTA